MGTTRTAGECAALVVRKEPEAEAALFGVKERQGHCLALFKTLGHANAWKWEKWDKEGNYISCLLNGKIISIIP